MRAYQPDRPGRDRTNYVVDFHFDFTELPLKEADSRLCILCDRDSYAFSYT
jgi:hypothetical protein